MLIALVYWWSFLSHNMLIFWSVTHLRRLESLFCLNLVIQACLLTTKSSCLSILLSSTSCRLADNVSQPDWRLNLPAVQILVEEQIVPLLVLHPSSQVNWALIRILCHSALWLLILYWIIFFTETKFKKVLLVGLQRRAWLHIKKIVCMSTIFNLHTN